MGKTTGRPRPSILAFAPGTWRWPQVFGSTRYHLWNLAELGWPVLYVEPPNAVRWRTEMWRAPDRPFWVLTPGGVPPFGVRMILAEAQGNLLRHLTARMLAREALSAARQLGLRPRAWWLGAPWHSALLEHLPGDRPAVHHVYDELSASPAFSPLQKRVLWSWEQELLGSSALVACSSMPQLQRRKHLVAGELMLLENAIPDALLASPGKAPLEAGDRRLLAALRARPEPRFAYGGTVDHRLNSEFILPLIHEMERGTVAFLGKRDKNIDGALTRALTCSPRVWASGAVPFSLYPTLYASCQVLILAHRLTPFTEAMYPEKLNEYLATDCPIVANNLPEVNRIGEEAGPEGGIVLAATPKQWFSACQAAARGEIKVDPERRKALLQPRLWSSTGKRLQNALTNMLASY